MRFFFSRFSIARNPVFAVFLFAIAVRAVYLFYNIVILDLPPFWPHPARVALTMVASNFGAIDLGEAWSRHFGMDIVEAAYTWQFVERGVAFPFMLIKAVFGTVEYLHVQILQLVIDALMVFPVAAVAFLIGGTRATVWAGITYALFLPQIQLAATPSYDTWLNFGYILSGWLMARFALIPTGGALPWARIAAIGFAIFVVLFVTNQFRSVIALFGVALALWYLMVEVFGTSSLRLNKAIWAKMIVLGAVGILVVVASVSVNVSVRDESSPFRSSLAHSFWAGVGQYENPYGIVEHDGSITAFYNRETGNNVTDGHSLEYNSWLTKRAIEFVKEYPVLYASMAARRALLILVPNFPLMSPVADYASFVRQPDELARIAQRNVIKGEHGRVSPTALRMLWQVDPDFVISLGVRFILLIAMPFGLIAGMVLSNDRRLAVLSAVPLAYTAISFAPFYVTGPLVVSGYVAIIPLVAAGWYLSWQRIRDMIKGKRPA